MIKVVIDTNVIVSGLLSHRNIERKILNRVVSGEIIVYGNEKTFIEFCEILDRPKLKKFREDQLFTKNKLIDEYQTLIVNIPIDSLYESISISVDIDDNEFFKIAKCSNSKIIVSRDKHVLNVGKYDDIVTVKPEKFLGALEKTAY